jgi:glycosyltransferase involved in cell wall biosynthesis
MYDEIFARVEQLGLEQRVRFLGYVPEGELPALYCGARAFVYPSRYEGFGLPVLEAMQCGTPVLTSNISSTAEVVGDAGLLVDPDDVAALSSALVRLVSDDALVVRLRSAGLKRAMAFSWRRCAQETVAVYHEAIAARRTPHRSTA